MNISGKGILPCVNLVQHQSPAGGWGKSWVWTETEKGDGVLDLSPIPDAPNVMYVCLTDRGCCGLMPVWYFMYLRTIFPKLIWCSVYFPGITDINFRVQRWAHKSPVCNKECDESGRIIWLSDVTVCLAAIAGVEMFPVTGCVKCWEDLIIVTLLIMERLFPLKVREAAFKKNRTLYISDIIFWAPVWSFIISATFRYYNTDPTKYALCAVHKLLTLTFHLHVPYIFISFANLALLIIVVFDSGIKK